MVLPRRSRRMCWARSRRCQPLGGQRGQRRNSRRAPKRRGRLCPPERVKDSLRGFENSLPSIIISVRGLPRSLPVRRRESGSKLLQQLHKAVFESPDVWRPAKNFLQDSLRAGNGACLRGLIKNLEGKSRHLVE